MSVIVAILILIACAMLFAVSLTVHASIRKQDKSERIRLTAENKMLRQDNAELTAKDKKVLQELAWYKAVFSNTEDMVFVHSVDDELVPGPFIDVNNVMCERLQYTHKELLKMRPMDIGYDESALNMLGFSTSDMVTMSTSAVKDRQTKLSLKPVRNLMKKIIDEGEVVYERTYITKDKKEFPVEVRARTITSDGKTFVICTAHDITDRKETQEALKESEQRFNSFFEHSPIGVALYSSDRKLVNVNLAFLRTLGIPDKEQFKRFDVFNFPFIPEAMREKVRTGESIRVNVDVEFDTVREKSMFISTRTDVARMDLMISNMGRDRNGKQRGFLVQIQDNTQSYEAQKALRSSEKQLRQAEKMEAIGSMAGGIAHDFNNILTPILGYTELGLRMCEEESNLHKFMTEIMKASHRAKDLVNQILTFSRQKEKDGQPIRMIPIVKEVLTLMGASVPEGIEIRRIIKSENDMVVSDPTQMHQVLMNLCTNAWHAMKEDGGGVLEVRVNDFLHEKGAKSRMGDIEPGRYLQISVCDTGCGMTPQVQERIFDPFFTTKKSGEGTGMGLSVVKNIITTFRGQIIVDSKVGEGTEFHIVLPVVEDDAIEKMQLSSQPLLTGNETVLIVDDDPTILEMAARMLETLGYKPLMAKNGNEALDVFNENSTMIDIVITDQVMPGVQGDELAAEIFAMRPDVPIVLCTGFSESLSPEKAQAVGITDFLKKPIIMRDLADVIRRSLESKRA